MKAAARRLSKVEASLTPKQQVLRWLDRMFSHDSKEAYTAWLVEQPISEWPRVKMARAVERAARNTMRRGLEEVTEGAVRNAVREVYFLTKLVIDLIAWVDERASLLVTSNLPFSDWGQVFQGERMTAALLDRLTHRCHIFEINGESYRFRESVKASKKEKGR